MTPQEQKLVEQITEQVMAVLRAQRGDKASTETLAKVVQSVIPGASIHPPVGICTGDYSKFTELRGTNVGASKPPSKPSLPQINEPLPLSGIITAGQLQDAMAASSDGVARLAPDARLTPLAADFVREHPKSIARVDRQAGGASQVKNASSTLPWLWWADGSCPAVDQTVNPLSSVLRLSGAQKNMNAMTDVVRDLASSIKGNRVQGGVLFVRNAARAMCYANRCLSIRAVIGSCDETVEQGINELGANVLVIEYPFVGQRAMAAMVNRFVQQPPRVPPAVERTLAELHRC